MLEITLPEDQLEGTVATFSHWLVEENARVEAGDPVAELETDKVSMEVAAPGGGTLIEIIAEPGQSVEPGTVLGRIAAQSGDERTVPEPSANPSGTDTSRAAVHDAEAATPEASASGDESKRHLVGPAVRRLLAEHELDIQCIPGTGRGGRVTRGDVSAYLNGGQARQSSGSERRPSAPRDAQARSPDTREHAARSHHVPHTTMRKAIANHMVESMHTSPHVTSVFEMDMTHLIEHRRWHKKEYASEGVNLTFTAYFLAALVDCFRLVPQMNARFHDDHLELFDDINIGVGTALGDDGLVVPVIRNVESKKLFDIAKNLEAMTEKARNGKLDRNDVSGGTFTLSNHGVSGSLLAAPIIINQPQVAILGVGKMEKRVKVVEVNGEDVIKIKPMCYVSLTIDHRAVDAHQTNRFLSRFVENINGWGE